MNKTSPHLPLPQFLARLSRPALFALLLVLVSWWGGALVYRELEGFSWIDAIYNAAMILGGMGPADPIKTDAGKLFASFYALYSGGSVPGRSRTGIRALGAPAAAPLPRRSGREVNYRPGFHAGPDANEGLTSNH